ncbi:5'/3'-nucleotidase SurE [Hyalangium rubrum]|uniref:5'-nucleotidase SurE n=1 Tax=Hyalangium rubrum TaxID=3103134 RepID=A0ABU5HE81_9BACT|nr:5'/3'-nucleotidase SurE [Hyalangium sp. s54d21]MDY7231773.1 5'/3'-nucleotidase SurE [Hyalangium sp. s54d21]
MHAHPLLSSLLVVSLGLASPALASGNETPPAERPLRILLTNDDGVAGAGLLLLRDTLCAAGYQVTVAAPAADRSGTSAALTLNQALRVTRSQFLCGDTLRPSLAVGGTPADAVLFGLWSMGTERPDLVISGMNSGQNVGRAVNHSGTVGAAVTAAEEGVPAIAVSIGLNFQDANTGFSQTTAAAPHAAAFVKTLIEKLRDTARHGDALLPDRVALNVNYPVVLGADGLFDPALVEEPRVTALGHGEVVHPQYVQISTTPEVFVAVGSICGLQVACEAETVDHADTTALERGEISITPLTVDGAVSPWLRARIHARLRR